MTIKERIIEFNDKIQNFAYRDKDIEGGIHGFLRKDIEKLHGLIKKSTETDETLTNGDKEAYLKPFEAELYRIHKIIEGSTEEERRKQLSIIKNNVGLAVDLFLFQCENVSGEVLTKKAD